MKKAICETIERLKGELTELSLTIHGEPELAFNERKAAAALTRFLEKHGFTVELGIAGLPTAFKACKDFGEGPVVAFLAEYDALPVIGHACGHNLIAVMAVGAGVGLASAGSGFTGKVVVLGTPGEEGLGGKIEMAAKGVFDSVDYALMIHPSGENLINRTSTACQHWTLSFAGQNCHSSNPQNGVNALTAMRHAFSNIDCLRALMPLTANVNGIITSGGTASNIITDKAVAEFTVRAGTLGELAVVRKYMERAINAAEVLTEAKAAIVLEPPYAEMYANHAINAELKNNMATLNVTMIESKNDGKYGSSDIGNVSLVVPSIHSYLDIGGDCPAHTVEFADASKSSSAHEMAVKGAMGLAMTGFDIMTNPELRERIKNEFIQTVPKYDKGIFEV